MCSTCLGLVGLVVVVAVAAVIGQAADVPQLPLVVAVPFAAIFALRLVWVAGRWTFNRWLEGRERGW